MNRLFTRIKAALHRHRYRDSGWNAYGIAVEQKCKCGKYRHHLFQNLQATFGGEPDWQPGPFPFTANR